MTTLGLDVGSSSVKAAVLSGPRVRGAVARAPFATRYEGGRAEVDPAAIVRALRRATSLVGPPARKVDAIALSVMSPALVLMDAAGDALTPVVTHQDRRSVGQARAIERVVGRERHLSIVGCRPTPGGIASTTLAWFAGHAPDVLARTDLIGQLNTFLVRRLTGARAIDPSNAGFTGLYESVALGTWDDALIDAVNAAAAETGGDGTSAGRVSRSMLPDVIEANAIAGRVTPNAAKHFGLTAGTPVLAGLIDGGGGTLLAGSAVGQLVNTCGSTDVLAVCTDAPVPHDRLLTRPLGVGRRWLSVATLAAAGSSLAWARDAFHSDLDWPAFNRRLRKVALRPEATGGDSAAPRDALRAPRDALRFDPSLAGDRASVEQPTGSFTGLTLAATRDDLLRAVADALARSSADRLSLLTAVAASSGREVGRTVIVSSRSATGPEAVLRRDWPGEWTFRAEPEASLRGLGTLVPKG